MKTKLCGKYVIAFQKNSHEIIEDGCVVFENDRVIYAGIRESSACPIADTNIHFPESLISPGLINLHCIANIDLQPLRIDIDGIGFPKSQKWFERSDNLLSDDELYTSALFSVASLLRHGSTTFCNVTTMASKRFDDPIIEPLALADAAEALGVRAYIAHNFQDYSRYDDVYGKTHMVYDEEKGNVGLHRATKLIEQLVTSYSDRVRGFLFPYTTQTCSDSLLQRAMKTAEELDVTVRSHFAQYPAETIEILGKKGISAVERMSRLGVLSPRTTLTHAIYLRGHPEVGGGSMSDDLSILADSGTNIAHCPVVFSRRGVLLQSFDRYCAAGINLALGTDTVPPDIVGEMRMASTLAKVAEKSPVAGTAHDVFNAATIGGAKSLGRSDLGRLSPGAKADITIFDLSPLHVGVVDDPIKALVHYLNGSDVKHVYIDGKQVLKDGVLLGLKVNPEELLEKTRTVWESYKKALVARDPQNRTTDQLYPQALSKRRS